MIKNTNKHQFLNHARRGFTLIELVVVIAVIGILATIATIGLTRYQTDATDAKRSSNVITIVESLEKYYDANGEYPSCSMLTQSAQDVSKNVLKGIDTSALVTPKAPSGSTNSIACNELVSNGEDFFQYEGDGSAVCSTGNACLSFTIKYKSELDGSIRTIASRRTTDIDSSGRITLTGSVTPFSTMDLAWSSVQNSFNYTVQISTNNTFTAIAKQLTVNDSTLRVTGLTPGTTYYVRVAANTQTATGSWSNTLSKATARIGTPNPTVTSPNPTTVTITWGAISNSTQYVIERSTSNSFPVGATTTSYSQAGTSKTFSDASPATTEYLRVKAVAPDDQGNWSAVKSILPIVPAPTTAPTITATISGSNAVGTAGTVTCSYGTPQYALRYHSETTTTDGPWSAYDTFNSTRTRSVGTANGYRYVFQAQAQCLYLGASSTSTTSGTDQVVVVPTPSTPTITAVISGSSAIGTAGTVTCSYGTPQYALRYHSENTATNGAWSAYDTFNSTKTRSVAASTGYRYVFQAQAQCLHLGETGGIATSGTDQAVVVPTPSVPSISAAMSGTNAVGTTNATCSYGTPQFSLRYHSENTGTDGAWSTFDAMNSTATRSVAASQGYRYVFQSQAQCLHFGETGSVSSSGIAYTVRPILQPAAPSFVSDSTTWGQGTYHNVNYTSYCPGGTSLTIGPSYSGGWVSDGFDWYDNVNYSGGWGSNDRWTFPSGYGSGSAVHYFTDYRCYTTHATSPNSPVTKTTVTIVN